jgi:hypothetical protein
VDHRQVAVEHDHVLIELPRLEGDGAVVRQVHGEGIASEAASDRVRQRAVVSTTNTLTGDPLAGATYRRGWLRSPPRRGGAPLGASSAGQPGQLA